MSTKIKVEMKPVEHIIKAHGLDKNGNAQMFHTMNVNRRIGKYMPHLTGTLETKLKHVRSGTEIEVLGPYAKYQYYGKVMVGRPPKIATEKPLEYTTDFNSRAGPYWDRALVAAEEKAMTADLQRYIIRKG